MDDPERRIKQNRNGEMATTGLMRRGWRRALGVFSWAAVIVSLVLLPLSRGVADETPVPGWGPLIERLSKDGYDRSKMEALFAKPEVVFSPDPMASKLKALIKRKFEKPAPVIPGVKPAYILLYESYLKPDVIETALSYKEKNREILNGIRSRYHVPGEIVVAIMLVETKLGETMGAKAALNTLASMALISELETILPFLPTELVTDERVDFAKTRCRQKANWAYKELKALIAYAEKKGVDPVTIPGSIFGAIGLCQFMPSNADLFGVDADGDGIIDLFSSSDAMCSIANYLKKNGWREGMSRERQHRVILSYNQSHTYANTVQAIADKLKELEIAKSSREVNDPGSP